MMTSIIEHEYNQFISTRETTKSNFGNESYAQTGLMSSRNSAVDRRLPESDYRRFFRLEQPALKTARRAARSPIAENDKGRRNK
jgi:hypothetical protein